MKSVLELLTEERRIRVMETGSRFNGKALIGLGSGQYECAANSYLLSGHGVG